MPPAFVGAVQQPRAPAVATLVDLAIVALASLVLSFSHHQAACSLRFETNVAKGEKQVLRNRIELLAAERQKIHKFRQFFPRFVDNVIIHDRYLYIFSPSTFFPATGQRHLICCLSCAEHFRPARPPPLFI